MIDHGEVDLAKMLGARQAFSLVAGRCSAADATVLRDIREGKKFLKFGCSWDEFCSRHLHVSRRSADRAIGLLNEFGPSYFAVAQIAKITPEEFRGIQTYINNNSLQFEGEKIALIEANTAQLSSAIASLRPGPKRLPRAKPWERKVDAVRQRLFQSLRQLEKLRQNMDATAEAGTILYELRCEIDRIMQTWVGG